MGVFVCVCGFLVCVCVCARVCACVCLCVLGEPPTRNYSVPMWIWEDIFCLEDDDFLSVMIKTCNKYRTNLFFFSRGGDKERIREESDFKNCDFSILKKKNVIFKS